jgi:hypothetical protein
MVLMNISLRYATVPVFPFEAVGVSFSIIPLNNWTHMLAPGYAGRLSEFDIYGSLPRD